MGERLEGADPARRRVGERAAEQEWLAKRWKLVLAIIGAVEAAWAPVLIGWIGR